jgi:hypothetical protein
MKILFAAALICLTLLLPSTASADATITSTCTVAGVVSSCSTGWYTATVTVSFSVSGSNIKNVNCPDATVSTDTAGQDAPCVVTFTDNTITGKVVTIKRDATAPTATGIAAGRAPDSNGWYNHAVGVTVSGTDATSGIASCTTTTYSGPDSGAASVSGTCTDNAGNVSGTKTLAFQYDATPPSVSAAPSRAADANGWYNHAVDVAFTGSDALSGVDSCTSGSYSGPDNGSASVAGTCRDKAGNSSGGSFGLKYDSLPPSIDAGTPDRSPDAGGWYNHRLVVTFAGTDATSGVASCDTPAYEKPDDSTASLAGRCRDNAGNVSPTGTFVFKFDSTPPKVSDVIVTSLDREVTLTWKASGDVASVKVLRTAGGAIPSTVYSGKRITTFTDKTARNGNRYTYLITATDVAGNDVVLKALATPAAALIAPRQSARVRSGATLRWRGVPKATYYNVQLWSRGRKVLTTWPAGAMLRLPKLAPGPYTWFVWPGIGARSQHRFGPLIGKSTFVLTG